MGINQAIYTSSAKGISKGGGMGIHTYNEACSELELSEFELSYCRYYFSGSVEEIPTLPTKYVYGKLPDGRYMAAEVTYIGQDYNKESGRMGNFISHMHSFEKKDLTVYPMEMYGSSDFLTQIDTADVDGTNEVTYLPDLEKARKGDAISVDVIQAFLSETDEKENDRMEMFFNLLAAVLKRDQIHKVIIYDTHENILKWLGAIEYALPLKCAREISFSSYEKDPTMAEFDIRGAAAGLSQGSCEEYAQSGQFYVFDGIKKRYTRSEVDSDFYQLGIGMGMIAYEALQEFHKFLQAYTYENADQDICKGYKLFQMAQGGMASLQGQEFLDAVSFEGKYGNKKSYLDVLNQLISKLENSGNLEKEFLENLQKLMVDFYKLELTQEEFTHILKLSLLMDSNLEKCGDGCKVNDDMWESIVPLITRKYREELVGTMKYLSRKNAFRRLGNLQAYVLSAARQENMESFVNKFFITYWAGAKVNEVKEYDQVIKAACRICKALEDPEERYIRALALFLTVQEIGGGEISGDGCESLLRLINKETELVPKKQFPLNLRKKEDPELDKKQAKCAFEAFNYTQRNHVDIPISRIRLLHLGKCIERACEDEMPLILSDPLKVYAKYPVDVKDIDEEELGTYFEQLADVFCTLENMPDDYEMLFSFWKMTDMQKKRLVASFAKAELDYFKKEKSLGGLKALLGAVLELEDYDRYLGAYVARMKPSLKEKVTEAMEDEKNKKIRDFWIELSKEEKTGRKSFFGFGKWNL